MTNEVNDVLGDLVFCYKAEFPEFEMNLFKIESDTSLKPQVIGIFETEELFYYEGQQLPNGKWVYVTKE